MLYCIPMCIAYFGREALPSLFLSFSVLINDLHSCQLLFAFLFLHLSQIVLLLSKGNQIHSK